MDAGGYQLEEAVLRLAPFYETCRRVYCTRTRGAVWGERFRMTKEVAGAPIMPESVIVRARKRCLEKSAGN